MNTSKNSSKSKTAPEIKLSAHVTNGKITLTEQVLQQYVNELMRLEREKLSLELGFKKGVNALLKDLTPKPALTDYLDLLK